MDTMSSAEAEAEPAPSASTGPGADDQAEGSASHEVSFVARECRSVQSLEELDSANDLVL